MWRRHALALTLAAVTASLLTVATDARAGDDKSGFITIWTVTAGGEAVGTESLRVVHSDSGAFFASGEQKMKAGKRKTVLKSHVQRDADDRLVKYRRVEDKRRGPGLFVFKRDAGVRIVGVNNSDKQADFPSVEKQHVWDPALWHDLALLVPRIVKSEGGASVAYFDVAARKLGVATFNRGATTQVTDAKGNLVTVTAWTIAGAPGTARTLYVDGKRLVGVRGEDRAMLLKDWTWDDGTKASGGDDEEDGAEGAGDGGTEDDGEGEGEVGP